MALITLLTIGGATLFVASFIIMLATMSLFDNEISSYFQRRTKYQNETK